MTSGLRTQCRAVTVGYEVSLGRLPGKAFPHYQCGMSQLKTGHVLGTSKAMLSFLFQSLCPHRSCTCTVLMGGGGFTFSQASFRSG